MKTTEKRVDRRVLKTKKAIYMAFIKLLSQKSVNEITVKEIADEADINRKTFYNYYSGVYSVVEELENNMISTFMENLETLNLEQDIGNPYIAFTKLAKIVFTKLTEIIESDTELYYHLFRSDRNTNLFIKIENVLIDNYKDFFQPQNTEIKPAIDIICEYCISGTVGVFRHWFNSDRKASLEDLITTINHLASICMNECI